MAAPETVMALHRRWLGILISPAAWTLHGGMSYFVAAEACQNTNATLGPLGPTGVRIIIAILTVVLGGATAWSALQGWRSWHTADRSLRTAEGATTPDFIALASMTLAVLLLAGIVYAGLPLIFVDVCSRIR